MEKAGEIEEEKNVNPTSTNTDESNKSEVNEAASMAGGPSGSKDLSKSLPEEAINNFIQGKRHMLVQDFTFAVQSLAEACELYCKHFGEIALECGEVYFLYGKALVRNLQQQTGILGDAVNKVAAVSNDEDESESSDEEEEEEKADSGEEKEKEEKNGSATASEENEAMEEEKEPSESTDSPPHVETEAESKGKENEPVAAEADESIQNASNVEENQETEGDDLELAWNILSVAKSIFERQGEDNKDAQLKICEILQLLAEVSMESDDYTQAIDGLKTCLAIQEKHLPPDDRLLAQTIYELGLATMLAKMYDEAIDNFTKTMEIFEIRKEKLKNTPISETVGGFEAAERQKEIEDVDSIITDVKEKIQDTKDLIINEKNLIEEAIKKKEKEVEMEFGKPTKAASSGSKPVSNITHLLKRKKPDDEGNDSDSKRIKISPSVPNGKSTTAN